MVAVTVPLAVRVIFVNRETTLTRFQAACHLEAGFQNALARLFESDQISGIGALGVEYSGWALST